MVVNVNLPTNFSIEMPQLKDIQAHGPNDRAVG